MSSGIIPKRLPMTLTDRLVNMLRCAGDTMIQLDLEFAEHLDAERLAKALDLSLDAEPVLGWRALDQFADLPDTRTGRIYRVTRRF